MSNEIVLITGANGFIAAHIVQNALNAGYRVRGTVRKAEDVEKLRTYFDSYGDKTEFVVVSDIVTEGAYDAVLDGVTFFVHTATPMPHPGMVDYKKELTEPTVKSTITALKAALKSPRIKRVVYISSIGAMVPSNLKDWPNVLDNTYDEKDLYDAPIDLPTDGPMEAYFLGKAVAERAAWDFMTAHPEANFDLVTTMPGCVLGPNLLQTSFEQIGGTNGVLWNILTTGLEHPFWYTNVHVEDIARAHIAALDKTKTSSGRYLLNGSIEPWSHALEYAKKKWPERKWADKQTEGPVFKWDSRKAKNELLGRDWIPLEKQIDDVVEQMIALGA